MFAKKNHLSEDVEYKLLVATTEAVNNAIIHGNKLDPKKVVKIRCYSYKYKIVISVRDYGRGFDPATLPNPTDKANLLKEHGRGVFLIRALMDDVKFKKLNKGMSIRMTLRK